MVPDQPTDVLHAVLHTFPPVQHAFAYGSGVFKQPGLYDVPLNAAEKAAGAAGATAAGPDPAAAAQQPSSSAAVDGPMLDFIFAVDEPVAWHEENLRRHAHHYSLLRHLGPGAMTAVAERLGAGLHFNTLVPWRPHQLIKYGVVRLSALQQDLRHWTTLYCAGRLHKPVAVLRTHAGVAAAQAENLSAALRCALLLLPDRFSTPDLLHSLCAISYSGDVRMGLAEDSRKVHRIVAGSEAGLRSLYAQPMLAAEQRWGVLQPLGGDAWAADHSPAAARQLAQGLPAHILERLAAPLGLPPPPPLPPLEAADQQLPEGHRAALAAVGAALGEQEPRRRARLLRYAVHAVVGASSRRQAVAGLLSAGLLKSARYGLAKLRKAWR